MWKTREGNPVRGKRTNKGTKEPSAFRHQTFITTQVNIEWKCCQETREERLEETKR